MVVRVPRFLAIPLCVIGGVVWIGQGIATFTAKPKVTVYAGESDVKVELLDSKQKVEATFELLAGERHTLTTTRGKHTVRSTKVDGTKHESSVKLGFADKYAVPTAPDQCFALVNIGAWYGASRSRRADITDATIAKRITKSEPYEFPDETYGTASETPAKIDYKDHPKLVTAVPCSMLAAASDGEILATLDRRLTVTSSTLTSLSAPKAEKPLATTGREGFIRLMGEQKADWMRVHEGTSSLAYRNKSGEFLIVDTREIPRDEAELTTYVANIEKPALKGVYRQTDLLPTIALTPKKLEPAIEIGEKRAGFVLRRPDGTPPFDVDPAALTAIGGDPQALATENAKTRFASAIDKCVAKIAAKPAICATSSTEETGIVLGLKDSPKIKGKVWLRITNDGLEVRKAAKKAPKTTDPFTIELTLDGHELTKGLN